MGRIGYSTWVQVVKIIGSREEWASERPVRHRCDTISTSIRRIPVATVLGLVWRIRGPKLRQWS